jgi:hypothetical protein
MKNHSLRLSALLAVGAVLLWLPVQKSSALEPRSWLTIDGKIIEAELVRSLGDTVELKDKDGRVLKYAKAQLSFGDLDYVKENSPPDKSAKPLGGAKPKLPNPAKDVKIDTKTFKKEAGDFKINNRTYRICETPHFKIMYLKPADPMGVAELAERLWIDTAFFHSTFIPKWHERKQAIILVNDDEAYNDVGSWAADMQMLAGNKEGAEKTRITWPKTGSGSVDMPAAQADEKKIFKDLRVFRHYRFEVKVDSNGKEVERKKVEPKGVWIPFNTNALARDLLELQAGTSGGAGVKDGVFAVLYGHAYYKELLLNGKSETHLAQAKTTTQDKKEYASAGGFKEGKWGSELRKMMKKGGEWTPKLAELMRVESNTAETKDIVFAYAFSRFLENSTEHLSAFNTMCQKMDVARQVPGLEEIAKIYGYADVPAMEAAWIAYMNSAEFN